MNFSFEPTPAAIISIAAAVISVAYILIFYCGRLRRVSRKAASDDASGFMATEDLPDVSVVVYAFDDADYLRQLLPRLLSQEYPAPFEVIVVNEGQSDATSEVVNMLALKHHNLYLTFTPEGARNLSRKKLALTLGVKAARHEVIIAVDADTRIESDHWMHRMAGHFANPECEVVLGASRRDADDDDMRGRKFRIFDSTADSVCWIAAALGRRPYRGTSHNLAYRRRLFFDNKGFSRSLNLRLGDDDIFVSEIARGCNTEVELSADSLTTVLCGNPRRAYREFRQRSIFTGRYVSKRSRLLAGSCSVAFWIWLAASVSAIVYGLPSLLPACVVAVLAFALWIPVVLSWRPVLSAFGYRPMGLALLWYVMTRPFHTFAARLRASSGKIHNFTWG